MDVLSDTTRTSHDRNPIIRDIKRSIGFNVDGCNNTITIIVVGGITIFPLIGPQNEINQFLQVFSLQLKLFFIYQNISIFMYKY